MTSQPSRGCGRRPRASRRAGGRGHRVAVTLAAIGLVAVGASAASASVPTVETKLVASDGAESDRFGMSVASGGGAVAVGAPDDSDNGLRSGSVYVLKATRDGGWTETKLTASDGANEDLFGLTIAMDGGRLVVGAPKDDNSTGAAYVYEPDGAGGWHETKLTASDGFFGRGFGWSVAAGDGRVVVGMPGDIITGGSFDLGAAYVYESDGAGGWTETKLTASDGDGDDDFGTSVAVADGRIVVGADRADGNELYSGAVYVYEPDGVGGWTETKLTASDAGQGDALGQDVSVADGLIVAGAPGRDTGLARTGAVFVFGSDGAGGWEETELTPSDGAKNDDFGWSVSGGDGRIVVGAPRDDDSGSSSGSVYVFEPDSTPPVLTAPDQVVVEADTIAGASSVVFTVTANDDVDGVVVPECVPPSGSAFPLGTTTVQCTATDAAGNSATTDIDVTVTVPAGPVGIGVLVDGVEDLGLPAGVANGLTGPLSQAERLLDDENPANDGAACAKLAQFLQQVDAGATDGTLTTAEADELTAFGEALSEGIGCG